MFTKMKTLVILASVAALTFISLSERYQQKEPAKPAESVIPVSAIETKTEDTGTTIDSDCTLPEASGSGSAQSMKFANMNFYIL
jgi:hypothetical protein